jgi:hypothetical protein
VKAISNTKSDSDAKPGDSQTDEVLREWRESAVYWQKHADTIRTMFAPVTQALVEDAEVIEGEKVLDVAGGAGEPSLTIAETVGPSGSGDIYRCRAGDGRRRPSRSPSAVD